MRRQRKTRARWPWPSSRMRWRCARRRTPSGVAARAAARCAQCGDAAEECGRGESEVEDEKEGSDSELRALKVVAVVKEEVEAEAVELRFLMQFVHPVARIVVQVME